MKQRGLISLFAILAACVVLRAAGGDEAKEKDLAAMQGEWAMVSGERDGNPMPETMAKTGKRVMKDHDLTVTAVGMLIMSAKVTIDATKNPKTIDYAVTDGPSKGKTLLGIYEINGDTLKSCFAPADKGRPTEFESKSGDGRTNSVWKKQAAEKGE